MTEMRIADADCADNVGTEGMSPATIVQISANLKRRPKAPQMDCVGPNACEFALMKRVIVHFRKTQILFD